MMEAAQVNRFWPKWHWPVVVMAVLMTVVLAFSVTRFAQGVGEPTLEIALSDTSLTTGETMVVTFTFSLTPTGFDDGDIDHSNAQGMLSPVAATPDDRVYRATFTPTPATEDSTNTIVVGTGWVGSNGLAPLGDTTSPNFGVSTVPPPPPPPGSGSSCPPPYIRLASPNGGEVLVGGSEYEAFWSMRGCNASFVALSLSIDDGAFSEVARSTMPTDGYYKWFVPDIDADKARLRAQLLGQGDVQLTADDSDGDFTIAATEPPVPEEPPAPAPEPSPAPAEPPAPDEPPASGEPPPSGAPPAEEPPPAPPTETPPVVTTPGTTVAPTPVPPPPPATAAKEQPRTQLERRFQTGDIPTGDDRIAPPPENPDVINPDSLSTMADATQQPTSEATAPNGALSLESVQGAVETASEFAPSALDGMFSFLLGALTMFVLMFGVQKWMKGRHVRAQGRCQHCYGTGEEPKPTGAACDECAGTGQVEEENEEAVECPHCKGEGEDPCHECDGTGQKSGVDCEACKGGGVTLGKEDEPVVCEKCDGEGEIAGSLNRTVNCARCSGSGKV